MDHSQLSSEHGHKITFKGMIYNKDGHSHSRSQTSGQESGGSGFQRYRLVILCLGLLDAALLIAAVVMGIYCTKASEGYLRIPHSAATPLIIELNNLQSNHSNVMTAIEEVQKALARETTNHLQLKMQVEQQKTISDDLQKQIETLRTERKNLQSNISVFEESCGRCLPGWTLLNSSCYFFSTDLNPKKNWPDSREDCISRGADLLVINDWEEQQFINANFPRVRSSGPWWANGFWIGLTDLEKEGTWVWVNIVTQVEPLYWRDREPNNHGDEGENCAAVHFSSNPRKTWFDGKCHHDLFYWICEMKQ